MANRAAVMTGLDTIELQDQPEPTPGPRRAVVGVEAVGVCGSDTAYFTVGRIADWVVDGPFILGHEAAGVLRVGTEVREVAVGDRVAIEPGTPCRDCRECMAGRYHLCPDLAFLATPPYHGALVEQMAIDARNLYRIPDDMGYSRGRSWSRCRWASGGAGVRRCSRVTTCWSPGAGPVGLLAGASARALGAGSVTLTDVSDFRLGLARSLGFVVERGDAPGEGAFDVLLECSGAPGVLAAALGRLRPAGRAAMIGMPRQESVGLPLPQLTAREISLSLVHRYNHTWPLAIDLVSSGRVDVRPLVTHHFPLAGTAEALTLAGRVPDSVKAVIHPQQ
ncbi:MAG: alcohol dehydrogenase catalytic domain-containing protein [Marmoricola sp.]